MFTILGVLGTITSKVALYLFILSSFAFVGPFFPPLGSHVITILNFICEFGRIRMQVFPLNVGENFILGLTYENKSFITGLSFRLLKYCDFLTVSFL